MHVARSYNWGWVDEKFRTELDDALPTDITMLATYETAQIVERVVLVCNSKRYSHGSKEKVFKVPRSMAML